MYKTLIILLIFLNLKAIQNEGELEKSKKYTNKLINESSPYLLQHAHNPVEWYPWSEEAFEIANKENKPIFLSIGYSTCHWCHVMEKESFENEEIAKLLNQKFINIKVDREERPDIDNIYMTVCQMMTGSGGWPLTIVMTPDKKPFFAGTYFPPQSRYGRIGLVDLINKIDSLWVNDKSTILENADEVSSVLKKSLSHNSNGKFNKSIFENAFNEFYNSYDDIYGGFGSAPKFPTPHQFGFLLRYFNQTENYVSLEMVKHSLLNMRYGGIFDHVGKGFHRYSTDRQWLLPHFEKMLYDQANLINAYSETYHITNDTLFLNTAKEIIDYLLNSMKSEEGGFYSAEDADSENIEGKFYVWEKSEIEEILKKDANFYCDVYNIFNNGNYTEEASGHGAGGNIPHLKTTYEEIATKYSLTKEQLIEKLNKLNRILYQERDKRVHPFKDKKLLTDWNSLLISAFCKYAISSKDFSILNNAIEIENFINEKMWNDNKLNHVHMNGKSYVDANLDDYSFYIQALLDLYSLTFDNKYLIKSINITNYTIDNYYSETDKAFYFTDISNKDVLQRRVELYDGAIPSGNSVMLLNLLRLNKITGNSKFADYSNNLLNSFYNLVVKSPTSFSQFLTGAIFAFNQGFEVVIVGKKTDENIRTVLNIVYNNFNPNTIIVWKESDNDDICNIADYTKMMYQLDDELTVYVCKNYTCETPTNDLNLIKKTFTKQNEEK